MSDRGSRQKAHRRRQKEKQQEAERRLEELSQAVLLLERERNELRGALGTASSDSRECEAVKGDQEPAGLDAIAVRFYFGEDATQLQLTRRQCRDLSITALADIWKKLVHTMAAGLDKMAAAPAEEYFQQQVEELVHGATTFMWAMFELNPHTLDALVTLNVECPSAALKAASSDPRDWPAILAHIQLSDAQSEQLLACRRTALHEMGALVAERENLWAQMQSIEVVEEGMEFALTRFTEASGLLQRLCANIKTMHTCFCFYLSYIYNRVLSSMQVAQYWVCCLPMGPDTMQLMSVLARQRDEPSNEELLMRAARPGTAAAASPGHALCRAGDWRAALTQPLYVLHHWAERPRGIASGT
ncbi:hypothetical protein COCOBI_15-3050 [Coccomyxa sp. Obi]|nr:hypothetical protein COCOBI_15-3050 [Coccomyxa sp. Obi]